MNISNSIAELKKYYISEIKGMALVSKNSYEVFFYGKIQGELYHVSNMVENDLIPTEVVEAFNLSVVEAVRSDDGFAADKMNIMTFDGKGNCELRQESLDCRTYKIKKAWKEENIKG